MGKIVRLVDQCSFLEPILTCWIWPPANPPNPGLVFGGHHQNSELDSPEAMGSDEFLLFVDVSQSHGGLVYDSVPGLTQELSWTLTNLTYVIGSYVMFHYVTGIPFEFNAGAYDSLTLWEQIDDGDQYTPTKKYLLGVPIGLFLISTHYTHYDLQMFIINCAACIFSVIPKLPSSHRLRLTVPEITVDE
ncbi:hypothetical protein TRICI_000688 [Trichomonascus ciferrii]|uniref:Protein ORM1 n=1 Tax=Trichomonascus ciferrii TaxID=44093 RepID=A0A642VCZ3_9ASCO|nr:hypothetical protein TRICI_000688 [Trichomonascus ciferrii]